MGRILIAGAGLAGLSCRLALKRFGIVADLIDLAPSISKPDNDEALVLTPNGTRMLSALGLSDLIRNSKKLDRWSFYSAEPGNKQLGDAEFASVPGAHADYPAISTTSSELIKVLLKAGTTEGQVSSIRMAAGVKGWERAKDGLMVNFTSSTMSSKTYDFVIGADGVGSRVRELYVGSGESTKISYPGWGYWHSIMDTPQHAASQTDSTNVYDESGIVEIWGQGKRFGTFPLSGRRICVFGTVSHQRPQKPAATPAERAKAFASNYEDFGGDRQQSVAEILKALTATKKMHIQFKYPASVTISSFPSNDLPVALIGDAAHAVLPTFHQGPTVAIADGVSLAHALVRDGKLLPKEELLEAVRAWHKTREGEVDFVRKAAWSREPVSPIDLRAPFSINAWAARALAQSIYTQHTN